MACIDAHTALDTDVPEEGSTDPVDMQPDPAPVAQPQPPDRPRPVTDAGPRPQPIDRPDTGTPVWDEDSGPIPVLVCSDVVCAPVAAPVPTTPCCTDEGLCGVDLGPLSMDRCLPLNAPGDVTEDCPEIDIMGVRLPGCCTPSGECGGLDTLLGLGCTLVDESPAMCGDGPFDGGTPADAG